MNLVEEFKLERIGKTEIPKPEDMVYIEADNNSVVMYRQWPETVLLNEYESLYKASFDPMFGRNARVQTNILAAVLHEKGITHRPNIFGNLPVEFLRVSR